VVAGISREPKREPKKEKKTAKKERGRAQIDEIMKYLFGVSKETLVNMLGSLFGQSFNADETEITQTNAEFVDESFDVTRGDLFYALTERSKSYHLHIELQTRADGHMAIRLLEYDIHKAAELLRLSGGGTARYVLPKSMVIHVEASERIPDSYEYELVDVKADGTEETLHRTVPVLKYWELTGDELIARQLYPLLPLQVFMQRGKLKRYAKESGTAAKREVVEEIKEIAAKIIISAKELTERGRMSAGDDDRIITALDRLVKYLNVQYEFGDKLNEEVETVIESVFTKLRREGVEEGKREGKREGKKAGVEENRKATAEKMILKNRPIAEIIEFSELSESKIKKLAKKLSKELVVN